MNTYMPENDDDMIKGETRINGVARYGEEIVYSATLGEVGGLYKKTLQKDAEEGHIISSKDMQIYRISARGSNCAASIGDGMERHIAIFDIDTGKYRELTEGEALEDYPSYSPEGDKIFFSSAGLALSAEGAVVGVGAYGIFCYHTESDRMDELLASDKFDYIAPKEDRDGNLFFIKRPCQNALNNGNILMDILLFPVRIIKAVGGWLNFFSIAFGGESLRSGRPGKDVKAKQKSEKELFIDGNIIHARQALKENQRRGEKFPGMIPHSWELIRSDKNGNQVCLKKGVVDYAVCENGDVVYSNGSAVIRLFADGGEQLIEKCQMANHLVEV
ncbi:MAG: hypothetical protein FWF05_08830 [Oscillospiraceae bacterium]|nr:hypothetical protein [Oscillospiraceae bacterium]